MIGPQGKFRTLTLLNWNGFFARTFDLDRFVTTLSGGNGAGKSTVMAAFVTVLIPDLSLLHFRNTTEAGATTASRDRGLHGKLRPGSCYAILEAENSKQERILAGVRLQQLVGRDHKVELKPFLLTDLPVHQSPLELFTEPSGSGGQVTVRELSAVKTALGQVAGASFCLPSSVSDYHVKLFELGVLPKSFRGAADRGKFYRLLEASLYGGISTAITRSLKAYLLPEQAGIKQGFQDLESAMRENRRTLEAIQNTQQTRDLFKQLLEASTTYVSADYMRRRNARVQQVQEWILLRTEYAGLKQRLQLSLAAKQTQVQRRVAVKQARDAHQLTYEQTEQQLARLRVRLEQEARILRYRDELQQLSHEAALQSQVVERLDRGIEAQEKQAQETAEALALLQTQLSDQEAALNIQQIQSIQYQQACDCLREAQRLLPEIPELTIERARAHKPILDETLAAHREGLVKQAAELAQLESSANRFQKAYQLLATVTGEASYTEAEALQVAVDQLQRYQAQSASAEQLSLCQERLQNSANKALRQQKLSALWAEILGYFPKATLSTVAELLPLCEQHLTETAEAIQAERVRHAESQAQEVRLQERLRQWKQQIPGWYAAQEAKQQLEERCQRPFLKAEEMHEALDRARHEEQRLELVNAQLHAQRQALQAEILALSYPDTAGSDTAIFGALAERLGGERLAERLDTLSPDEAPYWSALYAPMKHAIVVQNLLEAKQSLASIDELPDCLYLIEGDPMLAAQTWFQQIDLDPRGLGVTEKPGVFRCEAFPAIPHFGRTGREKRLQGLRAEADALEAQYQTHDRARERQKRLGAQISQFMTGGGLTLAFSQNPATSMGELQTAIEGLQRVLKSSASTLSRLEEKQQRVRRVGDAVGLLLPEIALLSESQADLEQEQGERKGQVVAAQAAHQWVRQYGSLFEQLQKVLPDLRCPPESLPALRESYQCANALQRRMTAQQFALADVLDRSPHFAYKDASQAFAMRSEFKDSLRVEWREAEKTRQMTQQALKALRVEQGEAQRRYSSLSEKAKAKQELIAELAQELPLSMDPSGAELTDIAQLSQNSVQCKQMLDQAIEQQAMLEKTIAQEEAQTQQIRQAVERLLQRYVRLRRENVQAKTGFIATLKRIRQEKVAALLYKKSMSQWSEDRLRSLADQALGALRSAVSGHEGLRDALRASEDPLDMQKKIDFYFAVMTHLKARIRRDIFETSDPIQAIEEMEVELQRLTRELTAREEKLSISAKSVSHLIQKAVHREQHRIYALNQHLQQLAFGQIQAVRLQVHLKAGHALLLQTLANAHQHEVFSSPQHTFSEALAKLYRHLIPEALVVSKSSPQELGEALLDYRNYLELSLEVRKTDEQWLLADSGALSTGEAIGTGMAILMMVVQSWEEESSRLRGPGLSPCRLLFLDEAARLDATSVATLFELSERLQMQLLIAAPDNIHPGAGTTYRLRRRFFEGQEQVTVIGLRASPEQALNTAADPPSLAGSVAAR